MGRNFYDMCNNARTRLGDLATLYGLSQSAFNRPSVKESPSECVLVDADSLPPSRQCMRFVIVGHKFIAPSIASLLFWGSPTTISRFIISIFVWVAIQCVNIARRFAHIGQEVFKRVQPSIANSYSTTAVIVIIAVTRVKTSFFHAAPRFVYSRFVVAMSDSFPVKAAARFCAFSWSGQLKHVHASYLSAIAETKPDNSRAALTQHSEAKQLVESLSGYVPYLRKIWDWFKSRKECRIEFSHNLKFLSGLG